MGVKNAINMRWIPGLYAVGQPDRMAPVLSHGSTIKLSLDALFALSWKGLDAWILVLDTNRCQCLVRGGQGHLCDR